MTKPKSGRPPIDNPRRPLSLALTVSEYLCLHDAAEEAGKPISVYIRERALAAARRGRK